MARLVFGRRDGPAGEVEMTPQTAARTAAELANILSKGGRFSQRNFTPTRDSPNVGWRNRDYFVRVETEARTSAEVELPEEFGRAVEEQQLTLNLTGE